MHYQEEFREYILSKVIWNDTGWFDLLIDAVCQIEKYPSTYLEGIIDKRRVSDFYRKIFDLTEKSRSSGVNHWLYQEFYKDKGLTNEKKLKICSSCEQEFPLSNFYGNGYTPNGTKKYKSKCKNCFNKVARLNIYNYMEEYFGSYSCKICQYDRCKQAIEFHHINPNEKDYNITDLKSSSKEKVITELEKGILLCANCHRETHYGLHPEFIRN